MAAGEESKTPYTATHTQQGDLRTYIVKSPHQQGEVKIRVLAPSDIKPQERLRVIYLLPVEAQEQSRYGDSIRAVQEDDLWKKHRAIYAAPSFSALPWYADHPTDPHLQQETYFRKCVIPLLERDYPVIAAPRGRLPLGFSKSGWGAWTLLLRHPEEFDRAIAWDAPLTMTKVGKYGNLPIFGTQENFNEYQITKLLRNFKSDDRQPRLLMTSYDAFRAHHQDAHKLLQELAIPHIYRDGPYRKHHWESGWVGEAVELLLNSE